MITYLIKSILCSGLFLISYYILLEKCKTYTFNRFYLLGSVVLSALLPLISIQLPGESKLTHVFPETLLSSSAGKSILALPQETQKDMLFILALCIYAFVFSLFLYRFIRNLLRLWRKMRTTNILAFENAHLILVPTSITPHTFLNYIFISQKDSQNQQILTHELTHSRQWHSIDIILIEFIQCILWFNPVLILYKKSIRLNHEFLADESVLEKHHNVPIYQQLLLDKITGANDTVLASSFNYSITKKRFIMMTSMKNRKQTIGRIVFSLIFLTITSLAFITQVNGQAPAIDEFTIYKNGKWQNQKLTTPVGLESNEMFLKSIQREIRYPESAKSGSVVGDVAVMFDVDTRGNLSNFTTVKKLQDDCDAEVIRAIKNSNTTWTIAEQNGSKYPSRFVLRVTFKLDDLKTTEEFSLSSVSAKALNPIVVVAYR